MSLIEVEWQFFSAPRANDGFLSLWIDDVLKETISGVDNDNLSTQSIDARLGAVNGVDSIRSGTTYFDAFESRRRSYIGPLAYLDPKLALASEDLAEAKRVVMGASLLTFGIIFL